MNANARQPEIQPEIDNHTTRLIVGLIALLLASLTNLFSQVPLPSISAAYWQPEHWPRNFFVGFLFAIGAFLLSYNGKSTLQMVLSKIAAIAAFCVALFPCACERDDVAKPVAAIHYGAAAVMFCILAVFCYFFFRDAWSKPWMQAKLRSVIYLVCGVVIAGAVLAMAYDGATGALSDQFLRFTFFAEAAGLIAFGLAWLTASRKLPLINNSEERLPLI